MLLAGRHCGGAGVGVAEAAYALFGKRERGGVRHRRDAVRSLRGGTTHAARRRLHAGDAVFLVAGVPGLDGAPGKLIITAGLLVTKGARSHAFYACPNVVSRCIIDGA